MTPPAPTPRALSIAVPTAFQLVAVPGKPRLFRAALHGVRVTAEGERGSAVAWTSTVTATGFRLRRGHHWSAVRGTTVTYSSGAATSEPAGVGCVPGQLGSTAVDLRTPRTAFSCTGRSRLAAASVSWDATVTVRLGPDSPAGSYVGAIVHSVY